MTSALASTIHDLVKPGKGILAADESIATLTKRFDRFEGEATPDQRRNYRELLINTPKLSESISGIILFSETFDQTNEAGVTLSQLAIERGVVPGIKVDQGLAPWSHGQQITQGLDGLRERLQAFQEKGARFAKWRAVFRITPTTPTHDHIRAAADGLAHYAKVCQQEGIVPMVEPEVLMDGDHSLQRCQEVSEAVLAEVFSALRCYEVSLEHMILKPNMVLAGADALEQPDALTVAEATVSTLRRHVPAAVPSINFLSGGQTSEMAIAHLYAMNQLSVVHPWALSFSFGRALQDDCMLTWRGESANATDAQACLSRAAIASALATVRS